MIKIIYYFNFCTAKIDDTIESAVPGKDRQAQFRMQRLAKIETAQFKVQRLVKIDSTIKMRCAAKNTAALGTDARCIVIMPSD